MLSVYILLIGCFCSLFFAFECLPPFRLGVVLFVAGSTLSCLVYEMFYKVYQYIYLAWPCALFIFVSVQCCQLSFAVTLNPYCSRNCSSFSISQVHAFSRLNKHAYCMSFLVLKFVALFQMRPLPRANNINLELHKIK